MNDAPKSGQDETNKPFDFDQLEKSMGVKNEKPL